MNDGRPSPPRESVRRSRALGRRLEAALFALALLACMLLFGVPRVSERTHRSEPTLHPVRGSVDVTSRVWTLLAPGADGRPFVAEERASAIAALGPAGLRVAVGILYGEVAQPEELGRSRTQWEIGFASDGHDEGERRSEALRLRNDALFGALRAAGAEQWLDLVRERCAAARPLDSRVLGARILGEAGDARSLEILLAIASSLEPLELESVQVQRSIEEPLARILTRDPDTFRRLDAALRKLDPRLLSSIARALGASGSHLAFPLLARLLGTSDELDLAVVDAIGAAATKASEAASPEVAERVREFLLARDVRLRRAAAQCAGKLFDPEACPGLILLLGSDDATLERAAHASLQAMAGKRIEPDFALWSAWHARETSWRSGEGARRFADLSSDDSGVVAAAISALLRHPLYRHEAAVAIAPLVHGDRTALADAAGAALVQLASPRAVPLVASALESADAERRPKLLALLNALRDRGVGGAAPTRSEIAR